MRVLAEVVSATVKWFDNVKGFGFLTGDDGTEYFVHYSCIEPFEGCEMREGKPFVTLRALQEVEILDSALDKRYGGMRAERVVKCP